MSYDRQIMNETRLILIDVHMDLNFSAEIRAGKFETSFEFRRQWLLQTNLCGVVAVYC